jgi:hypothetical protein
MDSKFKDKEPDWLRPPQGYEEALLENIMHTIRHLRTQQSKPVFSGLTWAVQFACFTIFLFIGHSWYEHKQFPSDMPDENILVQLNIQKHEIVEYLQEEHLLDFDVHQVAENIPEKEIPVLEKKLEPVLEMTPDMKEAIKEIAIEEIDFETISDF